MINKFFFKRSVTSKIAIVTAILAIICAIATYFAISSSSTLISTNTRIINSLLLVDLILFLTFTVLIAKRLFQIYASRNNLVSSSKIQNRILIVFCLLASIPTFIVAFFSTFFFNFIIESWFDKRITIALDKSVIVAESYLKEHQDVLKVRAKAMAMELDNNIIYYDLPANKPMFYEILNTFVDLNSVSEAVILTNNNPIIRSKYGNSLSFEKFPDEVFEKAAKGKVVIVKGNPDKIRAVVSLTSLPNSFLVVGKLIDSNVLKHIEQSQGAASKYRTLKDQLGNLQIKFSILFLAVSMLILIVAVWLGMAFSGKLIKPIRRLLEATEKIKEGNFGFRVKEGSTNDELTSLAKAFNLMTQHIAKQQDKIVDAYKEIEEKHKFSQTVLSGVSAGIVALSPSKEIILINDSALRLLNLTFKKTYLKNIYSIIPELTPLLEQAIEDPELQVNSGLNIKIDKKMHNIVFRVVAETKNHKINGFIITFDDMTELVQAQRLAAWSDVARRVAHEVKNPLTPIQLSAERLKTKFGSQVKDPEAFGKYLSTILRHTTDIAKIIGEFSNFAKMKTPTLEEFDIYSLMKDIVISKNYIDSKIKYNFKSNDDSITIFADQTQITQIIVNLIKNAEESIIATGKYNQGVGQIDVSLEKDKNYVRILVIDNGKGFDKDVISRLTEPYFTTRTKGTGLGLAIVQKIIDDHKGNLDLYNRDGKAVVQIDLPLN